MLDGQPAEGKTVAELEVLDQELQINKAAGAALQAGRSRA